MRNMAQRHSQSRATYRLRTAPFFFFSSAAASWLAFRRMSVLARIFFRPIFFVLRVLPIVLETLLQRGHLHLPTTRTRRFQAPCLGIRQSAVAFSLPGEFDFRCGI